MANWVWTKIRAWHAIGDNGRTLCGRAATAETSDVLPGAKTCESCLRILARRED